MSNLIVGYAVADITPPLGVIMAGYGSRDTVASGLNDPLTAQALVITADDTACALVATDLIGLTPDIVEPVRERAATAAGIPAGAIMVCASHTHWGPVVSGGRYLPEHLLATVSAEYRETLIATLAGLIAAAWRDRVPAVVAQGRGFADCISYNRRTVGPDGKTEMHLVQPPGPALAASLEGNRLAQAWVRGEHKGPRLSRPLEAVEGQRVGPADGEVPLLRFDHTDGRPLVALVNFACHAVCGGGDFYHFSADYPGPARQAFQALTGAPLVFTAGCAGDQVPRWRGDDSRQRVGKSLGAEAARVWLGLDNRQGDVPLACTRRIVKLPHNPLIPTLEAARAALAAHPEPASTDAVMERCMVDLAEEIAAHPNGRPAEIWALRIGEVGLVGLPGEVLTEIGLQIKQASPFAYTFPVSCANDCLGYLPTDDACVEGGYEPGWSPVGPGTERLLVQTSLELLRELAE